MISCNCNCKKLWYQSIQNKRNFHYYNQYNIISNNEWYPRRNAQLKNIILDMLYTVVTQWDHHNKRAPAWSQRLRQDFASVYAAQNDVFSFLTNFFPAQGNPPTFVPRPAIRFSLHEGPRTTIYGISAAYQGGPFSAGCRNEVAARKSGDAMVASSAPDECTPFLLRFLPTIKRRMIIFSGVYRDACERASGQNETDARADSRGRRRRFGGWMRVARLRREKRGRMGRRTEEWHSLSVDTRGSCSFGNASSLDPRPRGQRKEVVNVNLLMACAPGPFWESHFFEMNNSRLKPPVTHIHVCVAGTV